MSDPAPQPRQYRFAAFEADSSTGELRRQGLRVRLNAQSFQVLLLLLERAGSLVTRDEICRELWPDGTFVDYDHGVHSAINRIREALGDSAGKPRFVETLARRGYRFLAPVERLPTVAGPPSPGAAAQLPSAQLPVLSVGSDTSQCAAGPEPRIFPGATTLLATPDELPTAPHQVVQTLFILLQAMYLAFYIGALANLAEIEDLLAPVPHAPGLYLAILISAASLIPLRAFVLSAALFRPPGGRAKLLRLWPLLLASDVLWSLSPLLLLHHISFGLALSCTALLVYSPFAQRSLVLMGAAQPPPAPGARSSPAGTHP